MKKGIILLICAFVFISCKKQPSEESRETAMDFGDSLTSVIDSIHKQGDFNGFAVAIVDNQGTLYEKGFGYADVENQKKYTATTIQNIASVSKVLVGVALLKAQEMGKLHLDDPINTYLPFEVVTPTYPDNPITLRHLATHTSTIVDTDYYMTKNYIVKEGQNLADFKLDFDEAQVFNSPDSSKGLEEFLQTMLTKEGKWNTKGTFLPYKPGERYEYSNVATALAALVIEKATGTPFDAFTAEHILKPLKMTQSGWNFESVEMANYSRLYEGKNTVLPYYRMITYPDGNFITSIHDLSLFLTELIKGYNQQGTILTKESYRLFFTPQLEAANFTTRNTTNPYNESYNVGVFIGFGYSGYIGHTGGDPGVATLLFFDPKQNLGRILMVNTSFSGQKGSRDFYGIWDRLEKYQTNLK